MKTKKEKGDIRHIYLACATGFTILLMAFMSGKILPQPLSYLELAAPPFIAGVGELFWAHKTIGPKVKTWYVIAAVLASTALILAINYWL